MTESHASPADTNDLISALEALLATSFPPLGRIVGCRRRASDYGSSFALEELEVRFADGRVLALMFKDLAWQALSPAGRKAKPAFLYDPMREITLYQQILSPETTFAPRCYGTVADEERQRYWLFLEKAPGVELYQVGDLETWCHVARWLARMHEYFRRVGRGTSPTMHLLQRDDAFYRRWIQRACDYVSVSRGPSAAAPVLRLAERYEQVVDHLAALPQTLIHGEFYASNVLVDTAGRCGASFLACPGTSEDTRPAHTRPRVSAVDWEMAGIGPGLLDLAALVVGNWSPDQQVALASAYSTEIVVARSPAEFKEFLAELRFCRLHQAVQWLGWSPDWSAPAAHAHDWLGEVVQIAEELRLQFHATS